MKDNPLRLLVISYYFPPFKRVGARRWAKHVKYLERFGHNTFVLAGEFDSDWSPWSKDISGFENKITRVKLGQPDKPYFQTTLPKNWFGKLCWKLSYYLWQVQKHFIQYNYDDPSRLDAELFYKATKRLIKENNIGTVILSVGPFDYSKVLIRLKNDFPDIKTIIDFRDPWEESILHLNKRQVRTELNKQFHVLSSVDLAITVNDDISEHIRKIIKTLKVVTIPHSVDEEFLNIRANKPNARTNPRIIITYGGELYAGLENELQTMLEFLPRLEKEIGMECLVRMYVPYRAYESILGKDDRIQLSNTLQTEDYLEALSQSDFILLFKSALSTGSFFSSKFFEVLCVKKPVLFFGPEGAVSDFLRLNRLGFHILRDNLKTVCEQVAENWYSKQIPSEQYELEKHSFDTSTKMLVNLVRSING